MKKIMNLLAALIVLASCTSNTDQTTMQSEQSSTINDIAMNVTLLYEQIDAAFSESFAQGIDFIIANNYPAAFDPTALQTCALAKQPYLAEKISAGVPKVETLELVPNWVGNQSAAADWLLAGKSIDGNVYKFDLEVDLGVITAEIVEANGEVFLLYGWCDDPAN